MQIALGGKMTKWPQARGQSAHSTELPSPPLRAKLVSAPIARALAKSASPPIFQPVATAEQLWANITCTE